MGVARRAPASRTFRGTVEYDGTGFLGWQAQAEGRTAQGVLEEALARVLGGRVPVLAAGRTDALKMLLRKAQALLCARTSAGSRRAHCVEAQALALAR